MAAGVVVIAAAVSVARCGIDDLVSPGEGDRVALSMNAVANSAAVGSRAVRTASVQVVSVSGRTVTWTARKANGSPWLSLSASNGTVPSTITVSLDPTDLTVGVFQDTILFATGGNSGAPASLPVEFTVTECELRAFTAGEQIAGSLGDSDCEAPNRTGRFAQVYRFDGTAGDSVTVVMRSAAFDGYVVLATAEEAVTAAPSGTLTDDDGLAVPEMPEEPRAVQDALPGMAVDLTRSGRFRLSDSVRVPRPISRRVATAPELAAARIGATPLAESDHCQGVSGDACLVNVLLPEDGTYIVEATTANAGETGAYTLTISGPRAPNGPTLLRQFQQDSIIPVLEGGSISGTELVLKALVTDPDEFDSLLIEVEVLPVGSVFGDTATASGAFVANGDTAAVVVAGLVDDMQYHWQGRVLDETGRDGPWMSFGTNSDPDDTDFRTVVSDLPNAPTGLEQLRTDDTALAVGESTTESTVDFRATISDPDNDNVQLQVELRPVGTAFTGSPDAISSSALFASGTTVRLRVPVSDRTDYHWRTRAVDNNGLEGPWVSFGGNSEDEIDFSVLIPGAPDVPTGLLQLRSDATTEIAVGETIDENTVVFTGTVSDPDPGDLVRFVLEVRPVDSTFTGIPTAQSPPVSSGTAASITIGGLPDDTQFHWRAQARDESGSVASGWVVFGANADSPAPADVDFAIAIPATELAFTSQPPGTVAAGATFSVEVSAREASGTVDNAFNGDITVALGTDPSGGAATLSGTLTRTAVNGVVTFDGLSIDVTGTGYTLRATSGSLAAGVTNAFDVAASNVDADLSTVAANPDSITTDGETATITVTALDDLGNPVVGTTVALSATGAGNTLTQPSATTDASGQATGTLSSTVAEDKVVTATADGVTITQTVTVSVLPGVVDPASSTADVPDGVAGSPTTITVTSRDANGNALTSGGETVVVDVSGANTVTPAVTDNDDGTYTATYTPSTAGTDTVAISLNGDAITDSPFTSVVSSGSADPAQTTATVPDGTAGSPTIVTVQARDANGNDLATGGDNVVVTVTGANNATPAVTDNTDGTYTAQYTPSVAGTDNVAITLNGTAISGSPYTSTVSPGTGNVLSITTQASPSAQSGVVFAQQPTIQIVDGLGNPVSQAGVTVTATLLGGGTLSGTQSVATDANGTATFTNLAISGLVGDRTLQFSAAGFTAVESNAISITPGPVDGGNSTLSANPISITTDGEISTITVTARDGAGNPIQGVTVTLAATGTGNTLSPAGPTDVNGVYTGTLSSTVAENKTVSADIAGTAVTPTVTVSVTPGAANAGTSDAVVPNGTAGGDRQQQWHVHGHLHTDGGGYGQRGDHAQRDGHQRESLYEHGLTGDSGAAGHYDAAVGLVTEHGGVRAAAGAPTAGQQRESGEPEWGERRSRDQYGRRDVERDDVGDDEREWGGDVCQPVDHGDGRQSDVDLHEHWAELGDVEHDQRHAGTGKRGADDGERAERDGGECHDDHGDFAGCEWERVDDGWGDGGGECDRRQHGDAGGDGQHRRDVYGDLHAHGQWDGQCRHHVERDGDQREPLHEHGERGGGGSGADHGLGAQRDGRERDDHHRPGPRRERQRPRGRGRQRGGHSDRRQQCHAGGDGQ
jgi:hypothetical protein